MLGDAEPGGWCLLSFTSRALEPKGGSNVSWQLAVLSWPKQKETWNEKRLRSEIQNGSK